MAVGNSINEQTTGICGFTGTAFTGTAVTQYNVQVGGSTSSTLSNVAPSATSGVPLVSAGSSANPAFGTAVVAGGGTGMTSATSYAVLCGGTTSTNPHQSIAGVGSSGQVLTSNGAGALPTFQPNAPAGTTWVFINSQDASASADIQFTSGIDSTYTLYAIFWSNVTPGTTLQSLNFALSNDGGSTYHTSGYLMADTAGGTGTNQPSLGSPTNTGAGCDGSIYIFNPASASIKTILLTFYTAIGSTSQCIGRGGSYDTAETNNAVRFKFASGTVATGKFTLYGIKQS